MPTENAGYIQELVTSQPVGAVDYVALGDDELRQLKTVLTQQFPDIITKGVVNAVGTETLPDPDERLWSPDALLAWLIANWDAFSQTPPQTALSMRAWNSNEGATEITVPAGAFKMPMDTPAAFTGGTYDAINYRWIPGELGTYFVGAQLIIDSDSSDNSGNRRTQLRYYNGTTSEVFAQSDEQYTGHGQNQTEQVQDIVEITDVAHGLEFWTDFQTLARGFSTFSQKTYWYAHKISSVNTG